MSVPVALPSSPRSRASRRWLALFAGLAGALAIESAAQACGCLVMNDLSVPTVQAGERILFAQDSSTVTAIIQIQYQGKPGDFGWLVPLPAVPKNRLGQDGIDISTDEVFTQLLATTSPSYKLNSFNNCFVSGGDSGGCSRGVGCSSDDSVGGAAPELPQTDEPTPLVIQSSVGPYDFAVLKADSQADMLKWLQDNRFVIPAGTDTAVTPYIRPGAYFLALKLRANQSAGDVQPVVLRYQSDYPMIPINLTAVGAVANMGIQVWILGQSRAIPRNYYHVVLNDAQLDLFGGISNYSAVVTRAVAEAPAKHAFITEYAASSTVMRGVLDPPHRFDRVQDLSAISDPYDYVRSALAPAAGFTSVVTSSGIQPGAGPLAAVLSQYIPEPQSLVQRGVSLLGFYQRLDYYLRQDPQRGGPDYDATLAVLQMFNPATVTADLQNRIVTPTLDAGKLFSTLPKLTRLFTTLSPEDMNLDPVFGFNPDLAEVNLLHTETLTSSCDSSTLDTDSGLHVANWMPNNLLQPASLRIETMTEVGQPTLIRDNSVHIKSLSPIDRNVAAPSSSTDLQRGCMATPTRRVPVTGPLSLLGLCSALVTLRRRRRMRS